MDNNKSKIVKLVRGNGDLSSETELKYAGIVERFLIFLNANNISKVDKSYVEKFLTRMSVLGVKERTLRNSYIPALRRYEAFMIKSGFGSIGVIGVPSRDFNIGKQNKTNHSYERKNDSLNNKQAFYRAYVLTKRLKDDSNEAERKVIVDMIIENLEELL